MSKKPSTASTKKALQYVVKNEFKKLSKFPLEWDLKKHYYKSENDPQIEADASSYESSILSFCKKYKDKDFTKTTESLKQALADYEVINEDVRASKVMRYFGFRTTLNANDTAANKKSKQFGERFRKLSNELIFFSLKLGKVDSKQQKAFLAEPSLKHYKYFLQCVFESAKHQLTEPEERILNLRSSTSSEMWEDAVEKVISNRKITFKGKSLNIPEALEVVDTLSWNDKSKLWNLILDEMIQISEFAEHELTALVTHSKVSDELRGYKKPYSATILSYENNEKSVEALVAAISTKGFALSKKFYKIKARLHGKNSIPYVNKYDSVGAVKEPDFKTSVEVCRDTFYGLKSEYGEIFDCLLENGQIDVFSKEGKRGGAFMSATPLLPTFVMLNHKNNVKSLETLAHEMGHAVHDERSKQQPVIYQGFSTTTAETASTLFEQLTIDAVINQAPDSEKVVLLHDKISRDIATVQRQIAFFNFELEMHNHIRTQGLATKEELAKMMKKHLTSYLGPAVDLTERDGYSYVYIPHIRYGFYVYTYSYGHLISNLMIQKYKSDKTYIDKIDTFLSAGSIDAVENIFKLANIDALKVETFEASLKTQESEIAMLDKLTK